MTLIDSRVMVYVGPTRGAVAFPVIEDGADVALDATWTDVTDWFAGEAACAFDGHEHRLTLTLATWAVYTDLFTDDRMLVMKARWFDDQTGWTAWRVVFAGYVLGAGDGESQGSEVGAAHRGTVVCGQEWSYLALGRSPALVFGRVDLSRGRPATASSTLTTLAAEAGVEYLTAAAVTPDQAVDGNRDTLWVSNTIADPTPAPLLTTGKTVVFQEMYNGRGQLGTLGANGRPLWLELWCADVQHTASFESGTDAWAATQGATIASSTAWAAPGAGSRCLTITAPAVGGGAHRDVGNLTPEVEVAASFTLRSLTGADVLVEALLAGQGSTLVERLTAPATASGRRYTLRHPASRHGTANLRFKSLTPGVVYALDDVRISGGVRLQETGQPYKRLWLVWEDGQGGSGAADVPRELGLEAIGGDRSVILVDDADLFRGLFDAGDATVVQLRQAPALAGLDIAPGRGRLRLAFYRRWPDLPGTGGVVWDDAVFSTLPDFLETQSLVRTVVSPATYQARHNPAPGGAEATGAAWLQLDLGAFAPATLAASITAVATSLTLTSTAAYPAYGLGWLDNEQVWFAKASVTTMTIARAQGGTTAASHAAGAGLFPVVDGAKVTLPLVSAVAVRRRPGTPRMLDFDLIGSVLSNPADPSVPDGAGRTWGAHQDWTALATVRGNAQASVTVLLTRAGDAEETTWPPPVGWNATWGRPLRWLRLVIHRMEPWAGQAQRAKVNELTAYAADLASGPSGEWAGTNPPDVRGIVGHLLTQHAGLPVNRVRMERGASDNIGWGAGYGELPLAPATIAEALTSLETAGLLRVVCSAGNLVRVLPDKRTTSAAFDPLARTWDATTLWNLRTTRAAAHAVAQARVTARNAATGEVYRAAYPATPAPFGRIVDVSDAIAGDQAAAMELARRAYRQGNARWAGVATCGPAVPPEPHERHLLTYSAGDGSGVEVSNRAMLVDGYGWRARWEADGMVWETDVALEELA